MTARKGTRQAVYCALAAAGLTMSACTVQPLYAPSPAQSEAGAITNRGERIEVAFAPANTREDQLVRNALVKLVGTPAPETKFDATISASVSDRGLFASNSPDTVTDVSNQSLSVRAQLVLRDIETAETVRQFQGVGITSYERSLQQFANDRARRDAEIRASREAAEQLRAQLLAYLAADSAI